MLLELAIGDAYRAGFEYTDRSFIHKNNHLEYVQHPRHLATLPGMYTDDAQMSLAIAELIVGRGAWEKEAIAQRFVDVFKRDECEGYAQGFYNFLKKTKNGTTFIKDIKLHSDKSGAAMRAPLTGLYSDPKEVLEKAAIQASLTHNTKGCTQQHKQLQ